MSRLVTIVHIVKEYPLGEEQTVLSLEVEFKARPNQKDEISIFNVLQAHKASLRTVYRTGEARANEIMEGYINHLKKAGINTEVDRYTAVEKIRNNPAATGIEPDMEIWLKY